MAAPPTTTEHAPRISEPWLAAAEVTLIFLLFFFHAGWLPPAINEAHYLAKAKHFWNPDWCPGDHFLQSGDAHAVFYWTFGWLTLFASLPVVAWMGRLITWLMLAWGWQRLSHAVMPRPWFAVLTAALFLFFSTRGHMAGEWVIGGVEAKGFAYALVFFGLAELLKGRWTWTWLLLGAASSFHVLVGGWSVIAAGVAWLVAGHGRPTLAGMFPGLVAGGLLALPGLVPVLLLNHGTASEVVRQASEIYVFERLDHHLLLESFKRWYVARFLAMVALWGALYWSLPTNDRWRKLGGFVLGALCIGLAGAAIELITIGNRPLCASLMRLYWYRLVDVFVPAGLALYAAGALAYLADRGRKGLAQLCLVGAMLLAGFSLGEYYVFNRLYRTGDPKHINAHKKHRDWREICRRIDEDVPADERFLTPRFQQTFKWYAGRSEVVSWKDIPQDAQGVVQWRQRFYDVFYRQSDDVSHRGWRRSLTKIDIGTLRWLAEKYEFRYLVIDRTVRDVRGGDPAVVLVDQNDSFAVYRLRSSADASPGR